MARDRRTIEQYKAELDSHLAELRETAPVSLRLSADLFMLLGCVHFGYLQEGVLDRKQKTGSKPSIFQLLTPYLQMRYKSVIVPALRELFEMVSGSESFTSANTAMTLLGAVVRYDCLADCLATPAAAYGVVHCLLSSEKTSGNMRLHEHLAKGVSIMMMGWAKLKAGKEATSEKDLCTALFGEVWWDLRRPETDGARRVAEIIRVERPPFIKGLVTWFSAEDMQLPIDIGMAR